MAKHLKGMQNMKLSKNDLLLYAVTDRAWTGRQTLSEQVESAIKGGATCVQLREKNLDEDEFLAEAILIKALCAKYNVPFIVNDNVVHVGQDDMCIGEVRKAVGSSMIIGVSAQTVEEAVAAEKGGADYLGVGAVFGTATKPDAKEVSFDTLGAICAAVDIPVVAIGGINKKNMCELNGTGISGVALVSSIFSASDIEAECRELLRTAKKTVG